MSFLPGTGMFCIASYTHHNNTAPGQFNQFDNFDSVTALLENTNISSPVLDASIRPQDCDEYCDEDGDSKEFLWISTGSLFFIL